MARIDDRAASQLRPIAMQTDFIPTADGSVLVSFGNTRVLCTAMTEERVPPFLTGKGRGWLTAEYAMLPASTLTRKSRDRSGRTDGRSVEIQRLIGRSLRAAFDLEKLGERTITIDCDVLQGDGGTRTASVTGGFVALALACRKLVEQGAVERNPIRGFAAGISAGIVDDTPMLDLQYSEDSRAQVDLNCVMDERGGIIELQGTGEGRAFTPEEQQALVHLCAKGCGELITLQKKALGVGE